jgi:hypothetical protein
MNPKICAQLNRFNEELSVAVSAHRFERLPAILAAQKDFVLKHLELIDDATRRETKEKIQAVLLLAKASRAHCLDAIVANQRRLGVLTAYQNA